MRDFFGRFVKKRKFITKVRTHKNLVSHGSAVQTHIVRPVPASLSLFFLFK